MNLVEHLIRSARRLPGQPAVIERDRAEHDYATLARRALGLATALRVRLGVAPGDRVALLMRNCAAYVELLYACWAAGATAIPINVKLHPKEVAFILDDAGARACFVTDDVDSAAIDAARSAGGTIFVDVDSREYPALVAEPAGVVAATAPDDVAWLFYTSGTTGRPKGVMLTQRNLLTMGLTYFVDVDPVGATDAIVYAAPMSHGCGLYAIPHLMAGARHVVPASGGVDPAELFELGCALGPLSTFAAPTIVKRLVDQAEASGLPPDRAAAAFKTIVYGGAPMYLADIQRALRVMGPRFVQIYGQGETPMVGTALSRAQIADASHPRHLQRLASVGVAQTPVELRVADAQGRSLPPDEPGEVLVRGDSVMAGYWRNPEATAAAIRDGWLWTGDIGSLDADGFLTLKDRSKDLLISGGSNIYPREVEEVLLTAPGVAEAAVVGAPDPEWGEVVVAFVVARPGQAISAEALDAHCLARIARFKRPKRYVFVDELPKNHYGKVLKTDLRARLQAGPPEPG